MSESLWASGGTPTVDSDSKGKPTGPAQCTRKKLHTVWGFLLFLILKRCRRIDREA